MDILTSLNTFLFGRCASLQIARRVGQFKSLWWQGPSISASFSTPWSLKNLGKAPLGCRVSAGSRTTHKKLACIHFFLEGLLDTYSFWKTYIKPFNYKLFYAGDNPWTLLHSGDIFCRQLGDESLRERNTQKRGQTREHAGWRPFTIYDLECKQLKFYELNRLFLSVFFFNGMRHTIPVLLGTTLRWSLFTF